VAEPAAAAGEPPEAAEPAEAAEAAVAQARAFAEAMVARDRVAAGLGITIEDVGPGYATAAMTVTDSMLNGVGILHGGLTFLLADMAFGIAANSHGIDAVSRTCEITYRRPARLGDRLLATAREHERSGSRASYSVTVAGADGVLIAEFEGHSSHFGG
jgi:acyl-CoA thioesterase